MGFFKGLGSVITAPPRALWDLVTVDDEERARNEEKRRERDARKAAKRVAEDEMRGMGGLSDREFGERAANRWKVLEAAREAGIDPNVAIEAEMLKQRERENTLYTMQVMDQMTQGKNAEKEREMAELLKFLEVRSQQNRYQGLPQMSEGPMVRMPQRSY